MVNFDEQYGQGTMSTDDEFNNNGDDYDEESVDDNENNTNNNSNEAQEIANIFRQNIKEIKADLTTMQVRRTTRDRIFPIMKFTTEEILRDIKLRSENNILHFLLQDLNRLGDNDKTRAKFWLAYKSEVKSVLTTRKTEVCNQMKEVVVECKYK